MRTSAKPILTALIAALLLASAVGTASAGRLSISNQQFRVNWSRLEFISEGQDARCQVTLEGSFHSRTINKTPGALIGAITKINVKTESCEGSADARPARAPPWHVTYEAFTGTLPNPTRIRLLMQRFQFDIIGAFGVTCRMGTATDNVTGEAILNATREVTNIQPTEGRNIANLLEGGGFCPRSGRLIAGPTDGTVRLLNTTTRIRITLI
jgi:hypothetical protein